MDAITAHGLYALAWASFGAGHSLLARDGVKARLGVWLGPWYRLVYNGFAVLHIGAVVAVGWLLLDTQAYAVPPFLLWSLYALQALGAGILLVGLRGYDLGRFGGLAQIRNHYSGRHDEPEDEPLRVDGLHRYVRHPLYAGALLLLWGGAPSEFALATAVWASLYLWIGTVFEERALRRRYGRAYEEYRSQVPAVVPWRGRAL